MKMENFDVRKIYKHSGNSVCHSFSNLADAKEFFKTCRSSELNGYYWELTETKESGEVVTLQSK